MRKVTLQLQDINGEVKEEKEVVLGNNDVLVMHYPYHYTYEQAYNAMNTLGKSLEEGKLVAMPDDLTFTVIKVNDASDEGGEK